jgi:hypothetical protein
MTVHAPRATTTTTALDEIEPTPSSERRLVSSAGASVAIRDEAGEERIEVRDSRARLLFELDPKTGRTVVWAPDGDIAFRAAGNVELSAGASVRLRAGDELHLETGDGRSESTLSVGRRFATLSAEALRLAADRAELVFGETQIESRTVRSQVNDAKLVMGRLETITDRLFEQARSVYRTVEDLHQLKTGRARTLVRDGFELRAGHATIEADDDVKVDGKSIHLG